MFKTLQHLCGEDGRPEQARLTALLKLDGLLYGCFVLETCSESASFLFQSTPSSYLISLLLPSFFYICCSAYTHPFCTLLFPLLFPNLGLFAFSVVMLYLCSSGKHTLYERSIETGYVALLFLYIHTLTDMQ